ncbi:SDR family NAD(P)-dependent oxidoreductase [Thermodesulfobacteriota bacterium]
MNESSIVGLFDLNGKSAIVTGAGRGIGEGIAIRLAEAGADLLVTDIDIQTAQRTVETITSHGWKAHAVQADAGSLSDSKKVVNEAVEKFDRLDILVNNAGIYNAFSVLDVSEQTWDKVIDVNLKGLFFLSQTAAQAMIAAGNGGRIINICSLTSIHPFHKNAHYAASKSGVLMLTKSMALEFAPHDILVNGILPGIVLTPGLTDPIQGTEEEKEAVLLKTFAAKGGIPLKRLARPDDIAKTALFLVSGAADYITGTTVLVDGGYLLT